MLRPLTRATASRPIILLADRVVPANRSPPVSGMHDAHAAGTPAIVRVWVVEVWSHRGQALDVVVCTPARAANASSRSCSWPAAWPPLAPYPRSAPTCTHTHSPHSGAPRSGIGGRDRLCQAARSTGPSCRGQQRTVCLPRRAVLPSSPLCARPRRAGSCLARGTGLPRRDSNVRPLAARSLNRCDGSRLRARERHGFRSR